MDSWTLQGDSYTFLRSAPRTFSLCHRDGTPNHIEIFDIIDTPSQRTAISETTCLCDIFGDDCESSSLSNSAAVGPFVFSQSEEVDETAAAASPPVDDLNESSGSYHSAQGTSEGEEIFEDSRERLYSPVLQSESSKREPPKIKGLSSGHVEAVEDGNTNLELTSESPVPQLSTAKQSSEVLNSGERTTPSPGHHSSSSLSQEETASSLSSVENGCSRPPTTVHSEADDRQKSPSQQFLTPGPSPEPRSSVSPSSSDLESTQSLSDYIASQASAEPGSTFFNQQTCPSPELTSQDFTQDFKNTAVESRAILSSSLTSSSSSAELSPQPREALVYPELINRSSSPDTQASSPFSVLRGQVSLPDFTSRGSSPDIENSTPTPELISEKNTTSTPESWGSRLSAASTPAPRHTPPSPVVSIATSPEIVESSSSPALRSTAPPSPVISIETSPEILESSYSPALRDTPPSQGLLSAAFPAKTGATTPSPGTSHDIRYISTPSVIQTNISSPALSHSSTPSHEVARNRSSVEHRFTAPSPEIRITASSPEFSRREWSSKEEVSSSPLLEADFKPASSRSPTSSPHITGISYSVVQPEDRNSFPFPELSHLSFPEFDRTFASPDTRSSTPSKDSTAGSTGAPRDSPGILDFTNCAAQAENTYQIPSSQPKHLTPSPEPRYQTPSPDSYQSPSLQHRSRKSSPVTPSPEPNYHQHSPANLSTEYNPENSPLRNTPGVEAEFPSVAIIENHLAEEVVFLSFELGTDNKSVEDEPKSRSPEVGAPSPVSTSPFFAEGKLHNLPRQEGIEGVANTAKDTYIEEKSSVASFSEEEHIICSPLIQKEDTYNILPVDIISHSPNRLVSADQSQSPSLVQEIIPKSPVHRLEKLQLQVVSGSPLPESSSSLEQACAREHTRRQQSTSVGRENTERLTEDMAHQGYRRRTPSPPLTRFTPVHIIAPEKPQRHWQNRNRSPSQVVTSSPSGHLKKMATNRESPNLTSEDNYSQAKWAGPGTQLEMEREMLLEEDREEGSERQMDRGIERERKREEQFPEKGRGWQGDTSYRGEQVELSFNARNRKGLAGRRAASTSRETRLGLPTVHSYSECSLATRQLQQQQSLQRLASQQDTRRATCGRRLQPPAPQNQNSAPGHLPVNRHCQSSSSSMGSELDEADNEVTWFTDAAFSSLSSPELDYLDMYNSSHRSSTNISQPSTQESPAGVSAAWPAYADFRGSAPKLDSDELSFQQTSACHSDGPDPSRHFEIGSFECIDVAVEREDSRKVRRGVPKRQIQLKRKDDAEGKQDGSSVNSSPGVFMMMENPSLESHFRETFVRQHSTPATLQECYTSDFNPDDNRKNERKHKLQKSASLDDSCTKTKMATCVIKSVLSKKMQSADDQEGELSSGFEENSPQLETVIAAPYAHYLSSSLQSDCSLSSAGLCMRGEPSTRDETKPPRGSVVKSRNRPRSSSSSRSVSFTQTESEESDSQTRNATSLRSEMMSELKVPFDRKQSEIGVQQADDCRTLEGGQGGDSANATARNRVAPSATGSSSSQSRVTNRDQECENTVGRKDLQRGDKSACRSQAQEITAKAMGKKKASLNVCLTPEAENKPGASSSDMSYRGRPERRETRVDEKTEELEGNSNNQVKAPIYKVRDVRRLVKNTYNLSFKATGAITASNLNEDMIGSTNEEKGEERKEERRTEVTTGEPREQSQNNRKLDENFKVEREGEKKQEVKESKKVTLSPSFHSRRNHQSHLQPMQIEYKAVCLKENKNKMLCSRDESGHLGDKPQASLKHGAEPNRELQKPLNPDTSNYPKGEAGVVKSCQDTNMPNNEDKPVGVGEDRKPPTLGSLPRQPSREREVSTAVVLIRDGPSKNKTSTTQEEIPPQLQAPAAPSSPVTPSTEDAHGSSSHSVSMLLKEKGYQADIGAVVGDNQNAAGNKGLKHVNSLEIPLQTPTPSDGGWIESQKERTFSSSSTTSGPIAASSNADSLTKTKQEEAVSMKHDIAKQKSASLLSNSREHISLPNNKQKELGDFEAVKRLDPTFPPKSPAIRRFRPQTIEVKSLSKEMQKAEMPAASTGNNRPQTIEVKSIAKNSQKPAVPPKPSCRFKPADLGAMPNEAQRPSAATSSVIPQVEERPQTIVVSSPTIYRKISNDSTSNYSRKLSVSTVSSLKSPPAKTTETPTPTLSNQSTAPTEAEAEASHDSGQQQNSQPSPHSSSYTQRPTMSAIGPGLTSAPGLFFDPKTKHGSAGASQPIQPAVMVPDSRPQYPRTAYPHEQAMPETSNNTKQLADSSKTQVPGHTLQQGRRLFFGDYSQRTGDPRFYGSDDPPSYDERESFSPLMLPDLTPRRSNRYQPSSRSAPCSCTAGCPSHPCLTPPHHHRSPHNLTPPHTPGQALPYAVAQRPHQCRSDPQPMSYQPGSPKASPLGPNQPATMYQPHHQPPPCPPHPSLLQPCPAERPLQPPQHIDSRRPPVHRSPQHHPPGMVPYNDPGHGHSPGLPPLDPQYLCGPESLEPSYGSDYGGDSSSLYSESNYGQTPRRVLLDPETGKYFYIEVPVQPLRKMLFDPETGQYVEVLIPQQAMSHSGLYPPSTAPYPTLHNPGMYGPAPHYMPYAAPLPAHAQTQTQPPRYPESSAAPTMHPIGPGVSYRNPTCPAPKPEPQNHPPLDQNYLESMYYVPTGMNASPNPTPPDYYNKNPPNIPPAGGKRS